MQALHCNENVIISSKNRTLGSGRLPMEGDTEKDCRQRGHQMATALGAIF